MDVSTEEAEVGALSDTYEAALLANDRDVLGRMFLGDDRVLRFGIADVERGHEELRAWRARSPGVPATRRVTTRVVMGLAPGVVAVDLTFVNGDEPGFGRQSQTWVRTADGWRIARAHVSMQDAPPPAASPA
ncbi:MAG: hypothetical protein JWM12_1069 [Ilumatobacteraceae bacterium]|jgi:hypothetical protein|nr:hypothetical protein [Ilumatobacteraceae bacterium]